MMAARQLIAAPKSGTVWAKIADEVLSPEAAVTAATLWAKGKPPPVRARCLNCGEGISRGSYSATWFHTETKKPKCAPTPVNEAITPRPTASVMP
jgi:hypothetical protein